MTSRSLGSLTGKNDGLTVRRPPALVAVEIAFLAGCSATFLYVMYTFFWLRPVPSDPLQYAAPAVWGTTVGGYWPWLDRLTLANGLRLTALIVPDATMVAPTYSLGVTFLTYLLLVGWSYRRFGITAATTGAFIFGTGFLTLGFSSYLYPVQTEALFASLAIVTGWGAATRASGRHLLAGFFSGLAALSKVTGLFVVLYGAGALAKRRQWADLRRFLVGCAVGVATMLLLFIALYNVASLLNVVTTFGGLKPGGIRGTNLVSFVDALLNPLFFPPFLALVGFSVVARRSASRPFIAAAWLQVAWLQTIYVVAGRGGTPIPMYLHSAYVLAIFSLSAFVGQGWKSATHRKGAPPRTDLAFALCIPVVALAAAWHAAQYPLAEGYTNAYVYGQRLDVFAPGASLLMPSGLRAAYMVTSLCLIAAFGACARKPRRTVIAGFILASVLWGALLTGGLTLGKGAAERREADFFYDAASVLQKVPVDSYGVFVAAWNSVPHSERISRVYQVFGDPPARSLFVRPAADGLLERTITVERRIEMIQNEQALSRTGKTILLTDSIAKLRQHYPRLAVLSEVPSPWGTLQLVAVGRGAPLDSTPEAR